MPEFLINWAIKLIVPGVIVVAVIAWLFTWRARAVKAAIEHEYLKQRMLDDAEYIAQTEREKEALINARDIDTDVDSMSGDGLDNFMQQRRDSASNREAG